MQRIALAALLGLLALAGCAAPQPSKPRAAPPPEPLTATRPPPALPAPAAPAPPPPQVKAPSLLEINGLKLRPWEWSPSGGIRRGLWKTIVIHHSASTKATPQGMDAWHHQRGWENGLGYHFVIGNGVNFPDGEIFVGRRWKSQMTGAHCKSEGGRYFGAYRESGYFNEHGIGICLIGNFDNEAPTPKQLAALKQLVHFLCDQTGINPNSIHGHGEVTHKTECPGRNLSVAGIRTSINQMQANSR